MRSKGSGELMLHQQERHCENEHQQLRRRHCLSHSWHPHALGSTLPDRYLSCSRLARLARRLPLRNLLLGSIRRIERGGKLGLRAKARLRPRTDNKMIESSKNLGL